MKSQNYELEMYQLRNVMEICWMRAIKIILLIGKPQGVLLEQWLLTTQIQITCFLGHLMIQIHDYS